MAVPETSERVVAYHPHFGIYLGGWSGGGIAWWSITYPSDALVVPTFADEAEAMEWFADDADEAWHSSVAFATVRSIGERVDVAALREAGLETSLGVLAHPGWAGVSGSC